MSRVVSALLLSLFSIFASAYSVTIEQAVDGHDNLFYTDWGHWFTQPGDRGVAEPGSQAASVVSWGGSGFNFAGFDSISISASGAVVEDGDAAFNPDGVCVSQCGDLYFQNSDFRAPGLAVYSLIGLWSKSATEIDPFYDELNDPYGWRDITSGLGLLLIGSARELVVPDFSSAYLFLAVNDGGFADNSGSFDARITASVPEPSSVFLVLAGLAGLCLARMRGRTKAT